MDSDLTFRFFDVEGFVDVWLGFFGKGGHFNIHKASYLKLLELAKTHGWQPKADSKQDMSEVNAINLAAALSLALPSLTEYDALEGNKLIETSVFRRALAKEVEDEKELADSMSWENYHIMTDNGYSGLDRLKAFGFVQRDNIEYFDIAEIIELDKIGEPSTSELSNQEHESLHDALQEGIPAPSGGFVNKQTAKDANPTEWFSSIYGRALVKRFVTFCEAGEYSLINEQKR